jgi:thioredoxin reductase
MQRCARSRWCRRSHAAVILTRAHGAAPQVYIIHRFDFLEASKVMQRRALNNPKIEVRHAALRCDVM